MKIVEFSVQNYRSITKAHKIKLHDFTVLLGKNNEGKSNLLTALNVAMTIMMGHGRDIHLRPFSRIYAWSRDFPIQLQERRQKKESIFRLNFRLEGSELDEFHSETGIRGNEDIPIVVKIGDNNKPNIGIPKKGSPKYKNKSTQITDFISKRISFNYIQAVRTERMALSAIQEAIREAIHGELISLKEDERYQEALHIIDEMQQRVLDDISDRLYKPLNLFLPDLKKISIKYDKQFNNGYLVRMPVYESSILVNIDDGINTSIETKGDGIKSLVTLAILNEKKKTNGASVIAIEEPESHLHPGAIHNLVNVLHKMSDNNQVIISTHNPLFVQRNQINANIIVDNGEAHTAKNIKEIRDILGVWPSDNLKNARFVLVVEGEDDKISLTKILCNLNSSIKTALNTSKLIIHSLAGAGNLSHDLADLKNNMCNYIVLLDDDQAGREAAEKAQKSALLTDTEVKFTICNGQKEAEFEDCIKKEVYRNDLEKKYNVTLNNSSFRSNEKWSQRMKNVFFSQGSRWDDRIEKEVKLLVANSIPEVISNIDDVLIKQKSGFISGVIQAVETMLSNS
ncbi:MAG: hypothetical protein E7199_04175 [Schwartzia succinivorans]|nr:hypothetical protein [Schwartzia succinivorans]